MSPVAIVTGGAVRVGRALSLGMAEAGYDVVAHYHTSERGARAVVDEVKALGRRAVLVSGDLGDSDAVHRMAARIRETVGSVDLLVNSASTFFQNPLLEVGEEEWDRAMAVNVKGPFLLARELAPELARARGSVVNITDLSAFTPWTEFPHHSVSKAALVHLTRAMAKALAPEIRVNAVAPGTVLPPDEYGPEERERSRRRTLLGTLGSPQDVVRTVLFLARSPFVTGEVVVVDGGQRLKGAKD